MYYPYLRGRQYELIAIRELSESGKLSSSVIPIIEPVKPSSTLLNTVKVCTENNNRIAIIKNPQVGDLANKEKADYRDFLDELKKLVNKNNNIINAVIAAADAKSAYDDLNMENTDEFDLMAIYLNNEFISCHEDVFGGAAKYNVIPYAPAFRRIRHERIMISDRFAAVKKERNTDYSTKTDEFFSDDHIYCYDDRYVGFSDFSIVGQDYQETGFAPYAVAIHIVYFDDKDNSLRIRHFVSDSNDDISDPAGKFYQAATKLVGWNKDRGLATLGIQTLENLHKTGAYPGLGVVKKLSIMHHLELMGDYLERIHK